MITTRVLPEGCILCEDEARILLPNGAFCSARLLCTEIGYIDQLHSDLRIEAWRSKWAQACVNRFAPNPEDIWLTTLMHDSHFLDSFTIRIRGIHPIRRIVDLMRYSHRELQRRCFVLLSRNEGTKKTRVNCAGAFADKCRDFLGQFNVPLSVSCSQEQLATIRRARSLRWKEFEEKIREEKLGGNRQLNTVQD